MLKVDQVQRVKDLAAEGWSQRAISRTTGIARETVRGILNGTRPAYELQQDDAGVVFEEGNELGLFNGPLQRCPTCGGLVYMPCLACRIRMLSE